MTQQVLEAGARVESQGLSEEGRTRFQELSEVAARFERAVQSGEADAPSLVSRTIVSCSSSETSRSAIRDP